MTDALLQTLSEDQVVALFGGGTLARLSVIGDELERDNPRIDAAFVLEYLDSVLCLYIDHFGGRA